MKVPGSSSIPQDAFSTFLFACLQFLSQISRYLLPIIYHSLIYLFNPSVDISTLRIGNHIPMRNKFTDQSSHKFLFAFSFIVSGQNTIS